MRPGLRTRCLRRRCSWRWRNTPPGSPPRRIPAFASQTFRDWFARRPRPAGEPGRRVILWPDTFNDHFFPETLRAAVDVLEHLGYDVQTPSAPLFCGRPLYDFGMLSAARRRIKEMLAALDSEISARTPIVVLEPSCLSVFRDELVSLATDGARACRLKEQTVTLAELLVHDGRLPAPARALDAIVHGHCHQKALVGIDAERELLDGAGIRFDVLDSGCCGMAGAFGFERSHFDVSQAVGDGRFTPRCEPPTRQP